MPGLPLARCTAAVGPAAAAAVRHTDTLAVRAADERRCQVVQPSPVAVGVVDRDFEGFGEFAGSVTSPREVFAVPDRPGRL